MTTEERLEYNRQRREKYRAEHPVTTDKQRRIIKAWELHRTPQGVAEKQIAEEQKAREVKHRTRGHADYERMMWRERSRGECERIYAERMKRAERLEKIAQLQCELEALTARYDKGERDVIGEIHQKRTKIYQIRKAIAREGTYTDKMTFRNLYGYSIEDNDEE